MRTFTIDPASFFMETAHLNQSEIGDLMRLMVLQAMTERHINSVMMNRCTEAVRDFFDLTDDGYSHPEIAAQMDKRERDSVFNTERAKKAAAARHGKAPVAQRKEQGSSNPSVAGSSPAGRTDPKPTVLAEPDLETEGDDAADVATVTLPLEPTASLGTLLPLGLSLSGTNITTAKACGVDMDALATMFDEFKNFHINAGTLHPDWSAAWDKWFERKRPRKPRGAPRVQLSNKAPEPPPEPLYEPDVPDDD